MWTNRAIDTLRQDLRLAARKLSRKPAFTLVAILSLALGIGANTAIFSVVDAVLLRPLPYPEPERLVRLWETFAHPDGRGRGTVSVPNLHDWQEQSRAFEAMGAYRIGDYNLMASGSPVWVKGAGVTPEVFPMLGVEASLGRALGSQDEMHDRVVVLSDALWRSLFAADPSVVGRTIRIDGESYDVVGVMPPSFELPPRSTARLWTPLMYSEELGAERGSHWMMVVARLGSGVELTAAQAEMESIAGRLAEKYPEAQEDRSVEIEPLAEAVVARSRPALLALWAAVGFVLLIACGNVANLLLARAAGQRREFAVRAALGAGRFRLARQVFLESVLLSAAGGALGLAAGRQSVRFLATLPGTSLPHGQDVVFDLRVLVYCAAASFAAATLAGLVPALRASGTSLQEAMKERTAAGGSRRDPIRAGLVVAEVALALVVLIGASLLVRSFLALRDVDPGLRTEDVLTMGVPLPARYDTSEKIQEFYGRLLERVRAVPGVETAGTISVLPIQNWGWNGGFAIEGRPVLPSSQQPFAEFRYVGGEYFQTLGIPLLEGRLFDERDHVDAPPAVLLNQTAARRYWPGEDPVGQRLGFSPGEWVTVVGVVGDVRNAGLKEGVRPEIYLPHCLSTLQQMSLVVRTSVEPTSVAQAIRREVLEVDPEQPVFWVETMEQVVSDFLSPWRFNGILFGLFAVLALVLAMLGVYGVMSYNVSQRTGEIGLRMALGAARGHVLALVVRQGLALAVLGAAAGVAAALGLTRFLASQLYGVEPMDLATFGAVTLFLLAVALAACLVPARRAASVEPVVALRYE